MKQKKSIISFIIILFTLVAFAGIYQNSWVTHDDDTLKGGTIDIPATRLIDGSGNTILAGTNATEPYQMVTNFFTQNIRFVDAGHGSDTNNGDVNHPWATLQHAQVNTTAGWTIAFAPGSYVGTFTNSALNLYLSTGTTITNEFQYLGTNTISGNGTIYQLSAPFLAGTKKSTIVCKLFSVVPNTSLHVFQNYLIDITCEDAVGQFIAEENTTNVFTFHCLRFLGSCLDDFGTAGINIYASQWITVPELTGMSLTAGSILKTPILTNNATLSESGAIIYDVGYTVNSSSISLPTGTILIGSPIFNQVDSDSDVIGTYQIE